MSKTATFAGVDLGEPALMGVINVTSDSFSDGGDCATSEAAITHGRVLRAAGAAILDIGGESTRPGAEPVAEDEELRRVLPVVQALAADGPVSIDTRRAGVMRAARKAGASIVNDITALSGPGSLAAVAETGASVVLMHMQGEPRTMQREPVYADVVGEVYAFLAGRIDACIEAGISHDRIAIDPGIGFGKTLAHNSELLRRLSVFQGLGCPVVLGVSRKSFIERIAGMATPPKARLPGSLAAALAGVAAGVKILRVHDVAETKQALAVWRAINRD
ncbi:MAG: dihydropteroate synthase [Alphaproteobacteria bacterium]|nr:dihydropteroate synthase [Alphaproteobacteria bacterium]